MGGVLAESRSWFSNAGGLDKNAASDEMAAIFFFAG
jgi:hypothetical protein